MESTILVNSTLPRPALMPENPDTDVEGIARILLLETLGVCLTERKSPIFVNILCL